MQEPERADPGVSRCGAFICRQASRRGLIQIKTVEPGVADMTCCRPVTASEVVMTKPLASGAPLWPAP